jgi:hypothetical protein
MGTRFAVLLLLAAGLQGCVAYEYEHEFWIRVDGSGSVNVTGRPDLWSAFKGIDIGGDSAVAASETLRRLFEQSGLQVRKITLTRRRGRPYLFVSADFTDFQRLSGSPAFPDLDVHLRPSGDRLDLEGTWRCPSGSPDRPPPAADGLMAVRFHLPSKVYSHKNAFAGVERGNIVGWRQPVAAALEGGRLEFGAVLDRRSILHSTVALFGGAVVGGLAILGGALFLTFRRGRRRANAV